MSAALATKEEAGRVLSEDAPPVSLEQAAAILRRFYGLAGRMEALPSERDRNFRVFADGGGAFVLKITHPAEPRAVTNFQTEALRHIAAVDPALAVPSVLPALDGRLEPELRWEGEPMPVVRLLTYLEGRLLTFAPRTERQDFKLGAFLARLGKALRGFFHPAAGGDGLLWDVRQMPRVKAFVPGIANPGRRALLEKTFAEAAEHALPRLPALRAQVIHNDMNLSNVVVAEADPETVAGVIDFGDILHAPLVCDIAVGASYRWCETGHPFAGVARFVAGYESVTPLEDEERALILDLVRARLAITLAIVDWQAKRYPDKRAYVLRLNAELWAFLENLAALGRDDAAAVLKAHR